MPCPIVNVGYRSTNYWMIGAGPTRLLVDLGWPGSLGEMKAAWTRAGVPASEVRYGFATHYHMDHAGLAEELKRTGMKLIVIDLQQASIPAMRRHMKPQDHYVEISNPGNLVIAAAESRRLLASMELSGEIVPTPGHSEDSVSLLLDDGCVFTGDLPGPGMATAEELPAVMASWQQLHRRGARQVFPAHGPCRPLDRPSAS
ncbi:MAG: MBL fold metallo-hydrolase, partial [Terriglobales bacterium]